jgi:dimethylhistidine N-methyltransferase
LKHVISPRFTLVAHDTDAHLASLAEEVEAGLTTARKSIPCRFLYDEEGSKLFEEICEVPEYYLTRAERSILEERADEVAEAFDAPITLAELGSGNAAKTHLLIEAFLRAHGLLRYLPVDISAAVLEESAIELLDQYDALEVRAVASEYQEGLRHVRAETGRAKLVAWLGSSIGNLTRLEAASFLKSVRFALAPDDRMLVGIDLRKDARVHEAAYDDAAGVTARFSLNLLARINRELGADFDLGAFRHRAEYREDEGRVEIQIVSLREQHVAIDALDRVVHFSAGEGIHTENAFKYSLEEIEALAHAAGMKTAQRWLDGEQRFSLNLLAPA